MKITIPFQQTKIKKLLEWAQLQPFFCYFHPQQLDGYPYQAFPHQIVLGNESIAFETSENETHFSILDKYIEQNPKEALYGYFSYDLKNQIEQLDSENIEPITWDLCGFYKAKCILHLSGSSIIIESTKAEHYKNIIENLLKEDSEPVGTNKTEFSILACTTRKQYLEKVLALKKHILEGDIYEINYCINFSVSASSFNPLDTFLKLCAYSPTPFATLLKWKEKYVICASPERFIKLKSDKLVSQPIKGTARREVNTILDDQAKRNLKESEKERAENMMIVDLVRNDLAKSSEPGSVKVEELFGIYSFRQVHQMISTIVSLKKHSISAVEAIKNAFPMGSMTGAPKIKAMQLIEAYETHKRGIFSGSIGYFNGSKEFDFNVIIRSLFYDQTTGVIHYQVGSAITHDCDPEQEYEECLLKAQAIEQVLKQ